MRKIIYREFKEEEIELCLFASFNRYQKVNRCWRKEAGVWVLKDIAFVEEWSLEEYKYLVECLKNTLITGGAVIAAFDNNALIGFASVESMPFGSAGEYLQLSSLHVSSDYRNKGIGKALFIKMANKAQELGGKKLYISAHSSEETQAFYKAMGCVEALEYNEELVAKEPYDCQLEYELI